MKNDYYDWNDIFQNATDILLKSLAQDTIPISKASQLYRRLKKIYAFKKEKFPKEVTFRKRLHRQLYIYPNQRIYKTALYQLIGKYQQMSITALAGYLKSPYQPADYNNCYLFYTINKGKRSITDNRKILYATSKKMKKHFKEKILFISYDDDTIVLLCATTDAKEEINTYMQSCINKNKKVKTDE